MGDGRALRRQKLGGCGAERAICDGCQALPPKPFPQSSQLGETEDMKSPAPAASSAAGAESAPLPDSLRRFHSPSCWEALPSTENRNADTVLCIKSASRTRGEQKCRAREMGKIIASFKAHFRPHFPGRVCQNSDPVLGSVTLTSPQVQLISRSVFSHCWGGRRAGPRAAGPSPVLQRFAHTVILKQRLPTESSCQPLAQKDGFVVWGLSRCEVVGGAPGGSHECGRVSSSTPAEPTSQAARSSWA